MAEQTLSPSIENCITQSLYQPVIFVSDITMSEIDVEALFIVRGAYVSSHSLTNLKAKPESISETTDINEHTRFVLGGHEEFTALKEKRSNVHEVIFEEDLDGMIVQESSTGADFTKIKECLMDKFYLYEIEIKYDRPATIIFSDYGMGKTFFLQRAVDKIRNIYPEADTIFLNDIHLNQFFVNCKDKTNENFEKYFNIDITKSNIHLFIDNFENLRNYSDIVKIIQTFHLKYKNIKIWFACTKNMTRNDLESKFGTFASYLSPVTKESQIKYLKDIWNIQNDEFDSYIEDILKLCNATYWKEFITTPYKVLNFEFTSYPLHLKMIGAKFKPLHNIIPKEVDILDIYEHFIETNYNIDNLDESAAIKLSENLNIQSTVESNFEYNSILNFLAAKWFAKNVKLFSREIKQLFLSNSFNWQFGYFFNRFVCRESKLYSAVLTRDLESVKSICSSLDNVLPFLTDFVGRTVLHLSEDVGITEILIQNGARFDVKDDIFNWTALRVMDHYNNLEILNIFLKHDADVTDLHITLDLNETELSHRFKYAIENSLTEYVKYICEYCANLKISPKDVLDALYSLPEDCIMIILKLVKKIDPVYIGFCDQTPLFPAVEKNYFEAVKYMVHNLKYNIHHKCWGNNCTLLHIAAENGLIEIAKYLLELGIDINATDDTNTNAFITCCRSNQVEMLDFLVKQGIKTDICLTWGETPLQVACNSGSTDVVKYIFKNAGDLNLKCDENLDSCIYYAVNVSNLELIQFLLGKCTIDINFKQDGDSLLHLACKRNNLEIIKFLIQLGADVNVTNNDGSTPLFDSHLSNNFEVVKILFENGANLLHVNNSGETALHRFANEKPYDFYDSTVEDASINQIKMIEFLIDNGVDVNLKSSNGNTALHLACVSNTLDIVTSLVDRGADINAVNDSGNFPIQEANNASQTKIVEYLISKGAVKIFLNR